MEIVFKGSAEELGLLYSLIRGGIPSTPGVQQSPSVRLRSDEVGHASEHTPSMASDDPGWDDGIPSMPKDDDLTISRSLNLPTIDATLRAEAWKQFVEFVMVWTQGFGQMGVEQPDRLACMEKMGSGRYTIPVLVMAYEIGSLQRLVQKAYMSQAPHNPTAAVLAEDLEFCDQIACNMVQVSYMCFPDLAGTYDYSTRWRRTEPNYQTP